MLSYVVIFPNGKKYIGVTSRELKDRISDHKSAFTRVNNKFYRAQRKRFENQDQRVIVSNGMKRWLENNPTLHKKNTEKRISTLRQLEMRKNASLKQKAYVARTPDFSKRSSIRMKEVYERNPNLKEQISRSLGGYPIQVFRNQVLIGEFRTLMETSRVLNISSGNIGSVLKGKRNHAGGYTFKRNKK